MKGARVLLVEFASVDRFHRALTFPFLKARALSGGLGVRWLRFGVTAAGAVDASGGVGLSSGDLAALAAAAREQRPDTVVFSHTPAAKVLSALAATGAVARAAVMESGPTGAPRSSKAGRMRVERFAQGSASFDALLGLPAPLTRGPGGGPHPFAGPADHGFEAANEAAKGIEPLPFVFLGEECTYNRPFADSPFFRGVESDRCLRRGGCSFCVRPDNRDRWSLDAVPVFRAQLDAIARTCPGAGGGLRVRVVGEPAMDHIDGLAREALACRIRPLDLLIDSRADRFLRAGARLRRALRSLEGSGCRLHMSLMGVENFCSTELERLNKGLSPAQNIRAIRQLHELERDFPGAFAFREHGGLSMIVFTPWTSPAELALNLAVARLLGIGSLSGKFLTGRLRLYEGLPLTEAARRDGLLIDRYDDPLLDSAGRNMYEPEKPWRFRRREMESVNRVLARLAGGGGPADPVVAALDEAGGLMPRAGSEASLEPALAVVDAAVERASAGSFPGPAALVRLTAARLGERRGAPRFDDWKRFGDIVRGRKAVIGELDASYWLSLKPVFKLEPVPAGDIGRFERHPAFPNGRWRRRESGAEGGVLEFFFGRRARDVEEAVRVAGLIEAEKDGPALARAMVRMGGLLGYPACCSRAFAHGGAKVMENYFWLWVSRRVACPGPVPMELSPACNQLIEYAPCSLECAASVKRARRVLAALGERGAHARRRLGNPSLIFWDVQGHAAELLPEGEPSGRFRYRAGDVHGSGALVEAVRRGDELVVEDECMSVLRKGRETACLSGRAFLWWHRRCFQTAFWKAMLDFAASGAGAGRCEDRRETGAPLAAGSAAGASAGAAAAFRGPPTAFLRLARAVLTALRRSGCRWEGYGLDRFEETGPSSVRARLKGVSGALTLDIQPGRPGGPCFVAAGPFALTYPMDNPPDLAGQKAAVLGFAAAVEGVVRRGRRS